MAKVIDGGFVKADDPMFSEGFIITPLRRPKKSTDTSKGNPAEKEEVDLKKTSSKKRKLQDNNQKKGK